jgi:hypothetical protein
VASYSSFDIDRDQRRKGASPRQACSISARERSRDHRRGGVLHRESRHAVDTGFGHADGSQPARNIKAPREFVKTFEHAVSVERPRDTLIAGGPCLR